MILYPFFLLKQKLLLLKHRLVRLSTGFVNLICYKQGRPSELIILQYVSLSEYYEIPKNFMFWKPEDMI